MRDDRRELAGEIRETVPREPGAYAFLDAAGRLLYVGKSVNLRQRMGSYFRQDPLDAEPHIGRLVSSTWGFAWWQTRSELLALLLEDVLIKEHLPLHNTRQREFPENRYLELTGGDFPACLIVEHVGDFGTRDLFGPMKNKYFATTLRDILHEALGIRTCSAPQPVGKCLEYDIGRCSGPCRGAEGPDPYRKRVALAREFLTGDASAVLDRLADARDGAAKARHYEEAARLRDAIETCKRFEDHERFAKRFAREECAISCHDDGVEYLFAKGALVAPRTVVVTRGQSRQQTESNLSDFSPESAGARAVAVLQRAPSEDRRFLADRARIVCNWARRKGEGCRVWFDSVENHIPGSQPSRSS